MIAVRIAQKSQGPVSYEEKGGASHPRSLFLPRAQFSDLIQMTKTFVQVKLRLGSLQRILCELILTQCLRIEPAILCARIFCQEGA